MNRSPSGDGGTSMLSLRRIFLKSVWLTSLVCFLPSPVAAMQGQTVSFTMDRSKLFGGTTRQITVYVPAEYTGKEPACVYIGLDGLLFDVPTVFDDLIRRHEMPVTIAVGVDPGTVNSSRSPENPRYDRSLEFDGLNDHLARFILEEVLPAVERRKTPSGLPIRLSENPNDRAVGGASTGGIGAFLLGWERPDAFRRIFSAIGTFVGMRGGDQLPVLVRKTEPKPLRIFLQDGSHDEWMNGPEMGDWWLGNQSMLSALRFAGYDVRHVWGEGAHDDAQAAEIFPDAMRWLWRGWPEEIPVGVSKNTVLETILLPSEGWHELPGDFRAEGSLASGNRGEVAFQEASTGRIGIIAPSGSVVLSGPFSDPSSPLAFGPHGELYGNDPPSGSVVVRTGSGPERTIARGLSASCLLTAADGRLYLTESGVNHDGRLWMIPRGGAPRLLDQGLNEPQGVALSPDGLWLAVFEHGSHTGFSYRVLADGGTADRQKFYWLHVPDSADDSGAGECAVDCDGLLYVATRLGVQICDRNGRSRAILPVPGGEVVGVAFGGTDFQTLHVVCADHRIYTRKLKAKGWPPWAGPIKLPHGAPG
ncbi:MAG TPA: alpha/beta hydrolase-fold protein [Opitutaceae bacterium]|nr:alpha/beta hydrolase-fold protein [Opitutaceae bacterium]